MKDRSNNEQKPQPSRLYIFGGQLLTVLGTSALAAAALSWLDMKKTKLAVTKSEAFNFKSKFNPFNAARSYNFRTFINGINWSAATLLSHKASFFIRKSYFSAFRAAFAKNLFLGNRENLKQKFEGAKAEFPYTEHENVEPTKNRSNISTNAIVSAGLGCSDAATRCIFNVDKILAFHEHSNKAKGVQYTRPIPTSYRHYLKMGKAGFPPLAFASTANTYAFMAVGDVSEKLNKYFHPALSASFATIAVNAFSSVVTSGCGLVHQNRIIEMDSAFNVPSLFNKAKSLATREGARRFAKIYVANWGYSVVAMRVVIAAESLMEKTYPQMVNSIVSGISIFKQANKKWKESIVKGQDKERSDPTPGCPFSR